MIRDQECSKNPSFAARARRSIQVAKILREMSPTPNSGTRPENRGTGVSTKMPTLKPEVPEQSDTFTNWKLPVDKIEVDRSVNKTRQGIL